MDRETGEGRHRECGRICKQVTWCFTPSQPLRLYQGEGHSCNPQGRADCCYKWTVEKEGTESADCCYKWTVEKEGTESADCCYKWTVEKEGTESVDTLLQVDSG